MANFWQLISGASGKRELEPIAVVDIGSNSVRLVVYEGTVRAPTPIFNEKVLCGLGRTVASTNRLEQDAVDRALLALRRFHAIARGMRVKNVWAIATAAVREAQNGSLFIAGAERALGCRIEVLSGEKEAILAASGIIMGFVEPDGIAGDLGGGSLELIDIAHGQLNHATTLPLGGLRLIDTTKSRLDKALLVAEEAVASVDWVKNGRGRTFYAVGGTWRSLAKMYMEQTSYPLRVMHGFSAPTRTMIAFCDQIVKAKKLSSLAGVGEVAKARRDVLPYGAAVLLSVLKRLEPSQVVFSVFGVREGLLYTLLPADEKARDPLLSFADDYARLRSRSREHAVELCQWTDGLFESAGIDETLEERRLRHAACLLSDIGWRAHPDYRGEQSLNVIAHAGLGGIDHIGRIFLALAVYFRHAGQGESHGEHLSSRLKSLVSKRLLQRARLVGCAVRVAHMLSIGLPGVIDVTPLRVEGDRLVLVLPQPYADLDGERLRRRLAILAGLIGKEPHVEVVT
ncbi:MAG: Ppx/GppA family phosphatase [Hyphomicrobiaceae bacterium]